MQRIGHLGFIAALHMHKAAALAALLQDTGEVAPNPVHRIRAQRLAARLLQRVKHRPRFGVVEAVGGLGRMRTLIMMRQPQRRNIRAAAHEAQTLIAHLMIGQGEGRAFPEARFPHGRLRGAKTRLHIALPGHRFEGAFGCTLKDF